MADAGRLAERLAARIASHGPISVEAYMAEANAHYYATRDPFGAAGDFITAPEISQMFGELVGLWLADLWSRAGRPVDACYVELGPGRGTLAADALRAMGAAGLTPPVHFVETSPLLRSSQADRFPDASWHERLDTLPSAPLLVAANEFFDALPVRQLVRCSGRWHERVVDWKDGRFLPVTGPAVPLPLEAPDGTIAERSPAADALAKTLAGKLAEQGGAALIFDYGHDRSGFGETVQSVRGHAFADPWRDPGEQDLTAHVDFEALARAAASGGARSFGPLAQGLWLTAMGIEMRAAALGRGAPDRAAEIEAARLRLTAPDAMGRLFRTIAFTAPDWPLPAGF